MRLTGLLFAGYDAREDNHEPATRWQAKTGDLTVFAVQYQPQMRPITAEPTRFQPEWYITARLRV